METEHNKVWVLIIVVTILMYGENIFKEQELIV